MMHDVIAHGQHHLFFFFFAVLGLELLHLALSHSMSLFMQRVFSKQGFMELFAQAGFKP
jgi:hypothetical protein